MTLSINLHKILIYSLIAILAMYLVFPEFAYAQSTGALPTGNIDVPGTSDSDSWLKKFAGIIKFVVFLICIAAVGFGLGDSIFAIFRTVNDARSSGEWGSAIKQIGVILAAIIFALVIFALINEYVIDPLTNYGY